MSNHYSYRNLLLLFVFGALFLGCTKVYKDNYDPYPSYGYGYSQYPDYRYRNDYYRRNEMERRRDWERRKAEEAHRRWQDKTRNNRLPHQNNRREQMRCPSGYQPSERKCTAEERKRGCKDMRLSNGLGCVRR